MRYVYAFSEGSKEQADLLGGKGANLAEMTRLGLPVPPGYTITTEACRHYLRTGDVPAELAGQGADALAEVEQLMGRKLGDSEDPLLVSVRSGAKFSMPGMMDTILNVGLNSESVRGLAARAGGDEAARRFAWDSYRRLISMFGTTVLGVSAESFSSALAAAVESRGLGSEAQLDADALAELTQEYLAIVGEGFPQDPAEQLLAAVRAVFESWNTERAAHYRRSEGISDDLGTAVNVVAMVFGNLDDSSGTGVAFTRDPATGEHGSYGDYLVKAQGEDVVAGIRTPVPLAQMADLAPGAYHELVSAMATLEGHYRDLCDIEFTVERGKLWLLQTRVGKRTAAAAFRTAAQFASERVISWDEALRRVSGEQLAQLMFPRFDTDAVAKAERVAAGIPASPGAAVGEVVFDAETAQAWAAAGRSVILLRRETSPDDVGGMIAAAGIVTSRGGKTSHAAVVARGLGKTCVCGADELTVAADHATTTDGQRLVAGDVVSVDGATGVVYRGAVAVAPSSVVDYLEQGGHPVQGTAEEPLVAAVATLLAHADSVARLRVRANADTGPDAARARRFGAVGIGLARTEHMFLGERRELIERIILRSGEQRQAAIDALFELQRADFVEILTAMDSLPVTVRLLDPPLHEFLPSLTEVAVRRAAHPEDEAAEQLYQAVLRLHESNPMLGLRGVRLGIVMPELVDMQVAALAHAAADRLAAGGEPRPEVMVPLVAAARELELSRDRIAAMLSAVARERGVVLEVPIGTMIEVPRAALIAGELAPHADFFSFGTNDLTQMTWGFSRDDVEGAFFSEYLEARIFDQSPFETLDASGVGELVRMAVERGRATGALSCGVCGEHGGDPASIEFFHECGLDYVSCSPFRVPVARLCAGRAAVTAPDSDSR